MRDREKSTSMCATLQSAPRFRAHRRSAVLSHWSTTHWQDAEGLGLKEDSERMGHAGA